MTARKPTFESLLLLWPLLPGIILCASFLKPSKMPSLCYCSAYFEQNRIEVCVICNGLFSDGSSRRNGALIIVASGAHCDDAHPQLLPNAGCASGPASTPLPPVDVLDSSSGKDHRDPSRVPRDSFRPCCPSADTFPSNVVLPSSSCSSGGYEQFWRQGAYEAGDHDVPTPFPLH